MKTTGFTLVEMLVAMAVFAVAIVALIQFQSFTVSSSTRTSYESQRLISLTDVGGYIGDIVKAAQQVPDGYTIDGLDCRRTPTSGNLPCLAVVLPVVNASTGEITSWTLYAFRYRLRTVMASTERDNTRLDAYAYALQEVTVAYDASVTGCGAITATSTPSITCFTGGSGAVTRAWIADNLMLASGTTMFSFSTASKVVTIALQSVSIQGNSIKYTPSTSPYTLKVFARNAS
ncbi:PulJ/GspJ family protein [Deinococcus pimensis]|uniref:PulJ/GspJ family protein n=1 Tax=Deinococcus pimensis TaxID=309888 RepID=UPI0006949509|nr:prepilin-type N-terminal cleavage/methylation domain-containing protein [Deinococcus pimensis]